MSNKNKINGATIPYQLRPHKAIDRNLFVSILKKLDRYSEIDIHSYRYVGFGAAFLEDFKALHLEFGIIDMDCMENDENAYSRQVFNNPYHFLKLYPVSSTKYITSADFKQDINQIIWLDYASPKEIRQQLTDIELMAEKVLNLDVLKFTFNSQIAPFAAVLGIKAEPTVNYPKLFEYLKNDETFRLYLPENITVSDLTSNFSGVLRAMAARAVNRGLSKAGKPLYFNHISSFLYADGQIMTTITGIISDKVQFKKILDEAGLNSWEFYQRETTSEFIKAQEIAVPAMTISERSVIDKKIPTEDISFLAKNLGFFYGTSESEHLKLVEGYCSFYKYLPYYSKIIY